MEKKFESPDFRKIAEKVLAGLPDDIGKEARAFFLKSFIKEGFTDISFIAWPKRQDTLTQKLLSQSLQLRNSIKVERADMRQVVVSAGEGLPYAEIHNNGGTIMVSVTPKMRKFFWFMFKKTGDIKYKWMALTKKEKLSIHIPQRQFIGESFTLDKKIDALAIARIIKEQKNLNFKTI